MLSNILSTLGGVFKWFVTDPKIDEAVDGSKTGSDLVQRVGPVVLFALLGWIITKDWPKLDLEPSKAPAKK